MEQEVQKRYLTIAETAEFLGMSVHTLRKIVSPGSKAKLEINGKHVKPSKINKVYRFDRIALESAMSEN